jgi:chemotaxis protein methyltransferase CheR
MHTSDYEFIRDIVYQHSRINLGTDKQDLVRARLGKRLRATGLSSITDYCEYLRAPEAEDEIGQLIDAISTNHTYFFREEGHFQALEQQIIPDLTARREREGWLKLRIWSAACSSGEEPYSVAMAVTENFNRGLINWSCQIEATDISSRVLGKASAGIYPEETIRRLPAGFAKRYFQVGYGPQAGLYRVKPNLRSLINFRQLNLLEGPRPFDQPFQIILCRNVMIYFDRQTQTELISRLKSMLAPGGYLLVGHSESLSGIDHRLRMIRPATYQLPP